MLNNYDVVVVGGGLAGSVASRELKNCGLSSIILEARDRLGGRVYTSEFDGTTVELGGAWVHWTQPNMWSEINRYGLELIESGTLSSTNSPVHLGSGLDLKPKTLDETKERFAWITNGKLKVSTAYDVFDRLNRAIDTMCKDTYELITRPHDIFYRDISSLEKMTVKERIESLDLDSETRDLVDGILTTVCGTKTESTSLLSVVRWYALCNYSAKMLWDTEERYKVKGGIQPMIEFIASEGGDIRLSTPVISIYQDDKSVLVETENGDKIHAKAVIVTTPVNAMNTIKFTPELSEHKQTVVKDKLPCRGYKFWAKIKGTHNYVATAGNSPLAFFATEFHVDGHTLCYGFGPDSDVIDLNSTSELAKAIHFLMPDAEVVDSSVHDWANDRYSQGIWSMPRPGQLTKYAKHMQSPDGRVFLAGADFAEGWLGFMEGALASGIKTARQLVKSGLIT